MKANDRRNIFEKYQHLLKGTDFIIQPDHITSISLGFLCTKKALNSFKISRQATTTCIGDDGAPVLVFISSLIFGYSLLTAQTIKS